MASVSGGCVFDPLRQSKIGISCSLTWCSTQPRKKSWDWSHQCQYNVICGSIMSEWLELDSAVL